MVRGGQLMTLGKTWKLTNKLARVNPLRVPGWDPQFPHRPWLKTMIRVIQSHNQWRFCIRNFLCGSPTCYLSAGLWLFLVLFSYFWVVKNQNHWPGQIHIPANITRQISTSVLFGYLAVTLELLASKGLKRCKFIFVQRLNVMSVSLHFSHLYSSFYIIRRQSVSFIQCFNRRQSHWIDQKWPRYKRLVLSLALIVETANYITFRKAITTFSGLSYREGYLGFQVWVLRLSRCIN